MKKLPVRWAISSRVIMLVVSLGSWSAAYPGWRRNYLQLLLRESSREVRIIQLVSTFPLQMSWKSAVVQWHKGRFHCLPRWCRTRLWVCPGQPQTNWAALVFFCWNVPDVFAQLCTWCPPVYPVWLRSNKERALHSYFYFDYCIVHTVQYNTIL